MTAAELASFRSLLQAQAAPPPRPDGGLFARMRARLTVVEGTGGSTDAPPRARSPLPPPQLAAVTWEEAGAPVADPPPSTPPVFGRREAGAELAPAAPAVSAVPTERERSPVRLRRAPALEEAHATPDEVPPEPSRAVASPTSPGTIAGWSRARPPSAQRRILRRLEAVFIAELRGLEARIAADAPVR